MRIERTLFWFRDRDEELSELHERFYGLGFFLNRLLNEVYGGKKIKFININFTSPETFIKFPVVKKNSTDYYRGHMNCHVEFQVKEFVSLDYDQQKKSIWHRAFEFLISSAVFLKNQELEKAVNYAYAKGLEQNLNPDYKMVEADVVIHGEQLKAALWVNFREDGMYANLTLEREGQLLFQKNIDKTKNGIGFFLEMFHRIESDNDAIIIKGDKDIDYLPLRVPIDISVLK
jgi:hypothetical protein